MFWGGNSAGELIQLKQKLQSQGQDIEKQGQKIIANMHGVSEFSQPYALELLRRPKLREAKTLSSE